MNPSAVEATPRSPRFRSPSTAVRRSGTAASCSSRRYRMIPVRTRGVGDEREADQQPGLQLGAFGRAAGDGLVEQREPLVTAPAQVPQPGPSRGGEAGPEGGGERAGCPPAPPPPPPRPFPPPAFSLGGLPARAAFSFLLAPLLRGRGPPPPG